MVSQSVMTRLLHILLCAILSCDPVGAQYATQSSGTCQMTIKTASECQSAATALGYDYIASGTYDTTPYPVGCLSYAGNSGNFYFQESSDATTSCNPPADSNGYVSKCVCREPDHELPVGQ